MTECSDGHNNIPLAWLMKGSSVHQIFHPVYIKYTDHPFLFSLAVFSFSLSRPSMSTQYDKIGSRYKTLKDLPVLDIEKPSVLKRLGSVEGLTCLDLACGYGHWSHILVELGAAKVVGVDISDGMIKAARETLPESMRSKVSFTIGDCSKPIAIEGGPFDLVFAGWFLNYAPDYETMVSMWRTIHNNLKPQGRFVSIVPNAHCPMFEPIDDSYGIAVRPLETVPEGWKCRLTTYTEPEVEFDMFHFLHDFYERAAAEAGMVELKWHPTVPPDDERKENGFWDVYFLRPHMSIVTATRP